MTIAADAFFEQCALVFADLRPGERLTIELAAEHSQFVRFNGGRIRQIGDVRDAEATLKFHYQERTVHVQIPFSSESPRGLLPALATARGRAALLPVDPFVTDPVSSPSSHQEFSGELLPFDQVPEALMSAFITKQDHKKSHDFTGIYVGGEVIRAVANSGGLRHWYAATSCYVDYSLSHPSGRAVKGIFATPSWNQGAFCSEIETALVRAAVLDRPLKRIKPGAYRTYLAPDAASELVGMFSWNGISESSLRQGESCLDPLRSGEKSLSPLFHLQEDFRAGTTPRFNENGELSQETIALIEKGLLKNTLISSRTAKEYQLVANGAASSESLRAPRVLGGALAEADVLKALGTGLYLSNLHYLNWSDVKGARVTGMTRYSPLWVEEGVIVAPISDMRFDVSLYDCLGSHLEAVGCEERVFPSTNTYGHRDTGGVTCPGFLLQEFRLTL